MLKLKSCTCSCRKANRSVNSPGKRRSEHINKWKDQRSASRDTESIDAALTDLDEYSVLDSETDIDSEIVKPAEVIGSSVDDLP